MRISRQCLGLGPKLALAFVILAAAGLTGCASSGPHASLSASSRPAASDSGVSRQAETYAATVDALCRDTDKVVMPAIKPTLYLIARTDDRAGDPSGGMAMSADELEDELDW